MFLLAFAAPDPAAIEKAIDRLTQAQQKGAWDYIGIISVIATLIVLIVYTIETYRLRRTAQQQVDAANAQTKAAQTQAATALEQIKISQAQVDAAAKQLAESQRQTENAHRPIIILAFEDSAQPYRPQQLVFRNIGTAPALDVQTGDCGHWGGYFVIERAHLVQQGDATQTSIRFLDGLHNTCWHESLYSLILEHLGPPSPPTNALLTIHYRSPDGIFYVTRYNMLLPLQPDSLRFLDFKRKE
ncbi:hypothetical protein [Paludibaculum fermentans]|uniref:hypothetical protein n=1 Tax=Paludibaculum fermentans TaxID=1473598 RepID=UPI003EC09525